MGIDVDIDKVIIIDIVKIIIIIIDVIIIIVKIIIIYIDIILTILNNSQPHSFYLHD